MNGNVSIVEFLVENNALIDSSDSMGKNALHFSCVGRSVNIVEILLRKNKKLIHTIDNSGMNCLHYAVWNGTESQIEIASVLFMNKADPNCIDIDGKTPLHHASKAGKGKIIPILMQKSPRNMPSILTATI